MAIDVPALKRLNVVETTARSMRLVVVAVVVEVSSEVMMLFDVPRWHSRVLTCPIVSG
jgi:hypothetical protein